MTQTSVRHIGLEDPSARPGGLNRYLADLVVAQLDEEMDAEGVVLGDAEAVPSRGLIWAGLRDASLWRRLVAMRRTASRRPRPDLVDSHFALYALGTLLPLIGGLRRRPLVVHGQGPGADESTTEGSGGPNTAAKRMIERFVYRRAERVIVLSRAFAELVVERYGVDPSKVRRIPPGVDTERFVLGDQAAARRSMGIDPDAPFVVIAVRRLRNRMGLEAAIEAISQCSISGAQLIIVGEGPERARRPCAVRRSSR